LQTPCLSNFLVEVLDDWNSHRSRTGFDPVYADLISVSRMHGQNLIAEIVNKTHHSLEVPSLAAHALPYLAVIFEWPEGDQSIVGRTSAQDFGSGVSDM
jgi:hypothetical protein